MSEKFVLATHNPAKLQEMRDILSTLGLEVVSPDELGVAVDVEETGTTFAENAMLKAKAICAATGLPAIGDDSGLCVDALNGGPGVYSARYGGENLSDAARNKLLLESVKGQGNRDAHFTCSIACAFPDGHTLTAEERCDGVISYIPLGQDGFGYDPVFNYPPKLKTFAQMTPEEKAEVSHRGKALRTFADTLGAYLSEKAWEELEEEKQVASSEPPETETNTVETKAETVETVTEAVETEAGTVETVTDAVETEAETVETVTDAVETETETVETVTDAVETETEAVETEAETVEKEPDAVETEAETVETGPDAVETENEARRHKKKKKRKKHH